MKKIFGLAFGATFAILLMASCSSKELLKTGGDILNAMGTSSEGAVSESTIAMGLKEALTSGISKGVVKTSKKDGFFKNPLIKILWPEEAIKVANTLRNVGLGGEIDKVETSLNRAAERASAKAKPIFVNAIKQITFQDVMGILKGNDNAATDYLRRTTSTQLTSAFTPVINTSLSEVNATKHWNDVFTAYNKIPLVDKKVDTDLTGYVTGQALSGLFTMIEKEEKLIRKDPIARTTDILKKVFSLQDKS